MSQMYMDEVKGVSAVHVHKRMRSEGMIALSQLTLKVISCDSGTKSSLGLNCYFTVVYISTETDTRSCSASATDAASYPTYAYSDLEYQYTAQSYRIASPLSEVRIETRRQSEGSRNGNLHSKRSHIHIVTNPDATKHSETYQESVHNNLS